MADFSLLLLIEIAGTFLVAGFVKGVTGMGLPTVAMGVLGGLVSPLAAAGLLIIPSFITNVWQLLAGPGFGRILMRLWPMMLTVVIGTIGASRLLVSGDTGLTTSALGAVLIVYALVTLLARPLHVPTQWEWWMSPLTGLLTGMVTGGTGVFVIPAVPYLQSLGFEKDDLIQALGLSFTVSTIAITAGLAWGGGFHTGNLAASSLAIIPALLGMWLGQSIREKVSPQTFRRWFLLCLLLLGSEILLRPMI